MPVEEVRRDLRRRGADDKGKRKEDLPDISQMDYDFRSRISPRLMQMFVKEFMYLPAAICEADGFNELKNRLMDLKGSKWLFPDE